MMMSQMSQMNNMAMMNNMGNPNARPMGGNQRVYNQRPNRQAGGK